MINLTRLEAVHHQYNLSDTVIIRRDVLVLSSRLVLAFHSCVSREALQIYSARTLVHILSLTYEISQLQISKTPIEDDVGDSREKKVRHGKSKERPCAEHVTTRYICPYQLCGKRSYNQSY
jgi:hypothetical protein